ncbi:hypothetical protein POVWA2_041790 [Plasmodium ovale wallikeri]|uniref:Uncharacterized protein n=1 Tax=Plasmodium ovale wallikeri TaxID=864142 RepID=A0A1A8ZC84_PLAOA|nr:hypothetical protein POVWA2_041790 [Plasmodium ovale wallikeri]
MVLTKVCTCKSVDKIIKKKKKKKKDAVNFKFKNRKMQNGKIAGISEIRKNEIKKKKKKKKGKPRRAPSASHIYIYISYTYGGGGGCCILCIYHQGGEGKDNTLSCQPQEHEATIFFEITGIKQEIQKGNRFNRMKRISNEKMNYVLVTSSQHPPLCTHCVTIKRITVRWRGLPQYTYN